MKPELGIVLAIRLRRSLLDTSVMLEPTRPSSRVAVSITDIPPGCGWEGARHVYAEDVASVCCNPPIGPASQLRASRTERALAPGTEQRAASLFLGRAGGDAAAGCDGDVANEPGSSEAWAARRGRHDAAPGGIAARSRCGHRRSLAWCAAPCHSLTRVFR